MEQSAINRLSEPLMIPAVELASIKRRVFARIVDYVAYLIVAISVGLAGGFTFALLNAAEGRPVGSVTGKLDTAGCVSFALALLGYLAYSIMCEGLHGATLGKRMFGIRVVAEHGGPCSLQSATVRSLGFVIDGLLFPQVGLGSMSGSATRQRIGDKWAHTIVERTPANGIGQPSDLRFIVVVAGALVVDAILMLTGLVWPLLF